MSRILSAHAAYGATNLAHFWVQTEEDTLNAVLCQIDNVLTVAHVSTGNMDELSGFLYAVDANRMVCSADFAELVRPGLAVTGPILHLHRKQQPVLCDFEFAINPSLQEVHRVMKACHSEQFQVPEWEPFYLDMSHRIRHNCAVSIGVRDENGQLCACGFTVAQTEHNAILGGICVVPEQRQKGYGRKVVKALLSQLPQEDIYVFRDATQNREFYHTLGFEECGAWAEVNI